MNLYYSPLACSLSAHIICREAQLAIVMRRVDLVTQRADDGSDFARLNSMAQVPALVLDDGEVLTENIAVLLWLAAQAPTTGLVPAPGTFASYQVLRWLSFVATELHKNVNYRVFSPSSPDVIRDHGRTSADKPLAYLENHLARAGALAGTSFTVADAYLIWALTIMPFGGIALDRYPAIRDYCARLHKRESVAAAIAIERREYAQSR